MSSILWRCHRFNTSTKQWISRLYEEMVVPILWGAAYECVPEACNVRIVIDDFEREVGIDVWNPGMSSKRWVQMDELKEMSSDGWAQRNECCTAKIRECGDARAHVNVQDPNDELEPECLASRNVLQAVWRSAVCAWRQNAHRNNFANPWHSVHSASYLCDVHDAVCNRGHRLLSDQGGKL